MAANVTVKKHLKRKIFLSISGRRRLSVGWVRATHSKRGKKRAVCGFHETRLARPRTQFGDTFSPYDLLWFDWQSSPHSKWEWGAMGVIDLPR